MVIGMMLKIWIILILISAVSVFDGPALKIFINLEKIVQFHTYLLYLLSSTYDSFPLLVAPENV